MTRADAHALRDEAAEGSQIRHRKLIIPISVLFFLSGMTSLIYEIIWVREFGLVFGVTTYAVSTVLAAFFAGLAVGSFAAGRLIDRKGWHPLVVYGVMEGIIGIYAVIMPSFLRMAEASYPAVYSSLGQNFSLFTLFRFIMCFLLLAIPTILMGATLPVLSKLIVKREIVLGANVGRLYAVNTFGAVAGAICAGFYLVAAYGVPGAIRFAAIGNVMLCIAALLLSRMKAFASYEANAHASESMSDSMSLNSSEISDDVNEDRDSSRRNRLILFLAFVCGGTVLAMEVVWTRTLILILGSTTYSFATMLTAVLIGIALGSAVFARFADTSRNRLAFAGTLLFLGGLCAIFGPEIINRLPFMFLRLADWADTDFRLVVIAQFAICFTLVFIPTFLSGASFPILIRLYSKGQEHVGKTVADVYAVNTFGGIVGSLLGGFILIRFFGLQPALTIAALVLMLSGFLAVAVSKPRSSASHKIAAVTMLAACIVLAIFPPRFDTKLLFGGWGPFAGGTNINAATGTTVDISDRAKARLVYHKEGVSASVDVLEGATGMRAISINAQPVATTYLYDMRALKMLGHLPVLLHPNPKDVLIIGLGAGVSSGTIASYPSVRDVTVVELSEEVPGGTAKFWDWNHNVLKNPKLNLVINDGANYVKATRRQYDIISSDPIHPFLLGNGILYSYEHWKICRDHLRSDGILAQWLPLYQLSPSDFATVVGTFVDAFPNATMWFSGIDVVLIGSKGDTSIDLAHIQHHMTDRMMARDLASMGVYKATDLLGWLAAGPDKIRGMAHGARRNYVDYPVLEYTAPRALSYRGVSATLPAIINAVQQTPDRRFINQLQALLTEPLDASTQADVLLHRHAQYALMQSLLDNSMMDYDSQEKKARKALRYRPHDQFLKEALSEALLYPASARRYAGDYKRALFIYREAFKLDPAQTDALVGAIQSAFDLNNNAMADDLLSQASPAQRNTLEYRTLSAISALAKHDYSRARQRINDALAHGQESPIALVALGLCQISDKQVNEGQDSFSRALQISTSQEQTLYDIVRLCKWHGFDEMARKYAPMLIVETTRNIENDSATWFHYTYRASAHDVLGHKSDAGRDYASAQRLIGDL